MLNKIIVLHVGRVKPDDFELLVQDATTVLWMSESFTFDRCCICSTRLNKAGYWNELVDITCCYICGRRRTSFFAARLPDAPRMTMTELCPILNSFSHERCSWNKKETRVPISLLRWKLWAVKRGFMIKERGDERECQKLAYGAKAVIIWIPDAFPEL